MQSRRGLRMEGAWLLRMGGASTCGGGAKMQSRCGLRLEGASLLRRGAILRHKPFCSIIHFAP